MVNGFPADFVYINEGGENEMVEEKRQRIEMLYEAYRDSIFRLCLFYLKNAQLAEDAMQETFLKAWKKAETYRGKCSEKT